MADFKDHKIVMELLKKDQEAENEVREKAREVLRFINDPDGQWEDHVKGKMEGRPRYTFDRCNDIVDDIAGEMEQADFDIRVKPAGGDATKDLAKTYDGLIRNIENMSNATDIFSSAGRTMIASGFDAWEVQQRWGDNNTFDQDLYIDPITDAIDRVWFDSSAELPTKEDANWVFKLQSITKDKYLEEWPKGSEQSVSTDGEVSFLPDGHDHVIVGNIYYKTMVKKNIVELSNRSVYVVDEKFNMIKDELAARGHTVVRTRTREMVQVNVRTFDGTGWLDKEQKTVFDYLPIVPVFGNYRRSRNKSVWWGIITKKMDAQRVYNYSESRKVEEGALAPLEKIVATDDQIGAHAQSWAKLNTSADPVLRYQHRDNQPPPFKLGGAQINPGLESVSMSAQQNLQSTAGLDRLPGETLGLQSGVALELKQNKGDTRNYKYTASQERAICHTAKILIRAIPKVYDTKRQVRILNEDDSFDLVMLNDEVLDEDTKQIVKVNDLSKGLYDVTCEVGPAFKNRQQETAESFNEIVQYDPSIMELGRDVYFNNLTTPGMDLLAERARLQMLMQGVIPEEQMTDEEKELLANQEPQPDPVAEALAAEAQVAEDNVQIRAIEAARKDRELELKERTEERKVAQESMTEALTMVQKAADELRTQAETLKTIREALGVDTIVGPEAVEIFKAQARQVAESQSEQL